MKYKTRVTIGLSFAVLFITTFIICIKHSTENDLNTWVAPIGGFSLLGIGFSLLACRPTEEEQAAREYRGHPAYRPGGRNYDALL